jgi:hypothetical protein
MKLAFSLALMLALSGCATNFSAPRTKATRHIAISVVDETSGAPIAGVKVRASCFTDVKLSRERKSTEAITDEKGMAVVVLETLPDALFDCVAIVNNDSYSANRGVSLDSDMVKQLRTRPPGFVPIKADVVIKLRSKAVERARQQERDRRRAAAEAEAEAHFKNDPDYWPPQSGAYRWVEGEAGALLISKRREHASVKALGSAEDVKAIGAAVLAHEGFYAISEIRWISSTEVILRADRGNVGYTYVLRKKTGTWSVLTYYMDWIE